MRLPLRVVMEDEREFECEARLTDFCSWERKFERPAAEFLLMTRVEWSIYLAYCVLTRTRQIEMTPEEFEASLEVIEVGKRAEEVAPDPTDPAPLSA